MTFSEETLMAYADDELDAPTRMAVESAMAQDPEIAERVARHQALRGRLRSTFDKVLDEPPPDRLIAAARGAPAVRREDNVIPLRRNPAPPRWSWPQWGSIAASLIIGVFVGEMLVRSAAPGPITTRDGQLVASGVLAHALSDQLASNQAQAAPVRIGVSFKSKLGEYCRTFEVRESTPVAGFACRERAGWRVQVLAQGESGHENGSQLRPAGSSLPRSVLQAVDDAISGEPLDASAETAARSKGWSR